MLFIYCVFYGLMVVEGIRQKLFNPTLFIYCKWILLH
nr:MAG TPA: hypothetical protein [Caudoviricetes sp.]